MNAWLDAIVESKRREINALPTPTGTVSTRVPLDCRFSLQKKNALSLIAEIKKKSPSAGALSTRLTVEERALIYARQGASMISVLCDGPFFGGSWDDVTRVRQALDENNLPCPVLAKEFILSELQLDLARAHGADAALLIVRIVSTEQLKRLISAAFERSIEPLVEVASAQELPIALDAGARLIGVNARDLDSLAMDVRGVAAILKSIPPDVVSIRLSGLKNPDDVREVAQSSANAALIGEALMRVDDPADLLKRMILATSRPS